MKRKTIAALLIIAMIMGFSVPAYAEDTPNGAEPPQTQEQPQPQEPEQEQTPVVVSTLEELQAAIDTAEDADTIALSNSISFDSSGLSAVGNTEKRVRLVPTTDFSSSTMFFINGVDGTIAFQNIEIDGIEQEITAISTSFFKGEAETYISLTDVTVKNCYNRALETYIGVVTLERCMFDGNRSNMHGQINFSRANATMSNCVVQNGIATGSSGGIMALGTLQILNCKIINNVVNKTSSGMNGYGGGITSEGDCIIKDSVITGNTADFCGGVHNGQGTLTIENSLIYGNIGLAGCNDLYGKATITYSEDFDWNDRIPAGWYIDNVDDRFDGESNITDFCGLELDGAAVRSLVFVYEDEITLPEDEDTDIDTDKPTEPDTPPDDPEDSDGGEDDDNPEQQPTQPPEEDDGSEDTPEQPTQPDEPEDNDNSGDDTNTPVEPSEPPQDEDSPDDENTPPVIYRPPYRPTRPIAPDPEPEDPVEPEPTPALVCGVAAIDASHSIILLGYGDGELHEEDPLTRAQLATIIYRLLDEASLEKFMVVGNPQFTDVPADSWCYKYVQTIASAGIVFGVGGGNYDPNGVVTWGQIITVLSRFVEPQEYALQNIDYDGWALQSVQTAASLGWIEDSADFNPDAIISRGALVQLVNGILEQYKS